MSSLQKASQLTKGPLNLNWMQGPGDSPGLARSSCCGHKAPKNCEDAQLALCLKDGLQARESRVPEKARKF